MPQLAHEVIVPPAQNRHCSSCARVTHPCGGPTIIGLPRRQVSVPWGVKSVTNSSHYNASAATSQLFSPSQSSVGRSPRCGHLANSAPRAQKAVAPSAIGQDLRRTLGTTLVSLVRTRVVAELERCSCPILYSLVPNFLKILKNLKDVICRG